MLQEVRRYVQQANYQPPERPPHRYDCNCSMCACYEDKKINEFLHENHAKMKKRLEDRMKAPFLNGSEEYMWLLGKLQLPNNKIVSRGVQFFIPEMCFYRGRQPESMFLNKDFNDYTLKYVSKERLSNLFIRKTFNQRRRKYREKLAQLQNTKEQPKKKTIGVRYALTKYVEKKKEGMRIDTKDAVVTRYSQGYEELMNETDFLAMMEKRRGDPYFDKVLFIKNYVPIKDDAKNNHIIKFNSSAISHPELLKRASTLMRVYGLNILKDEKEYISDEDQKKFCQALCDQQSKKFFEYLVYKLVKFVEVFHDVRIFKGHFHWKVDQFKRPLLFNAYKFQYVADPTFDWTNQIALERTLQLEHKIFEEKELPEMKNQEVQVANQMEEMMDGHYEGLKTYYGLSLKIPENTQETENNLFFRKLHPECQTDLSVALAQTETLMDFKKSYLGYKPEKKPLVTDFRAGMLSSLHNLTKRRKSAVVRNPESPWSISRLPLDIPMKSTSRPGSTRASFKYTIEKLDQLNRTLNFHPA